MTRLIFGPLTSRSTYRRWAYLIVGGAMLVPYLLFAAVVLPSMMPFVATFGQALVIGGVTVLAALFASSFIPAVRVLEATAVRELLDDPVPDATSGVTGGRRLGPGLMFMAHVLTGGVVGFLSLAAPVLFALSITTPFTGMFTIGATGPTPMPRGWASAWLPAVLLLVVFLLFHLVAGVGTLLTRAAPALLGLPVSERVARLERQAGQLAERNRLARELHDSVGHALSVVSIQAGAARRTLRRDPDTAERALLAIENSTRAALDDLDHVLGLLRDDKATTAARAGLTELPALLAATEFAGVSVDSEVRGELDAVTPLVSREAYRILQECLTNVLRHAGKVPVAVRLHVGDGELRLTVRNPLGAVARGNRTGGGHGLRGIAERVDVLGGEFQARRQGKHWEVAVRLPTGMRGSGS